MTPNPQIFVLTKFCMYRIEKSFLYVQNRKGYSVCTDEIIKFCMYKIQPKHKSK